MKVSRPILAIVALVTFFNINQNQAADLNGPNQWIHKYSKARKLSRELGLPVIVHFHASWCGPCKQMERETLSSRQLKSHLGKSFIGVKIDSDQEPGLVEAFRVESLPSDIVIAPGGRIVGRTAGYQSQKQYIATVQKWQRFLLSDRQKAIIAIEQKNNAAKAPKSTTPNLAQRPMPIRPLQVQPTPQPAPKRIVGLDGYSPVQLKQSRRWIRGNAKFSATHDGIVYHLSTAAELRTFLGAPHRYAPRMLGCDPVELWKSDRAIAGSVEFGAFFENELFLFTSINSRNEFKRDPARYVRMRHVLRADNIQGAKRF